MPPRKLLPRTTNKHRLIADAGTAPSALRIDLRRTNDQGWTLERMQREFNGRQKTPMPTDLKPALASAIEEPFNDQDWQFEIKWDGYRALAYTQDGKAELRSRNNLSLNAKFAPVVNALRQWPVRAVLDGEVVVLSDDGKADFGALQNYDGQDHERLRYYVFDLLWVDGLDLRGEALHVRRKWLKELLPADGLVRYSDSVDECGVDFYNAAKATGLEGIVAKQKNSLYADGSRSGQWLKIKAEERHEAIICGYTKKRDSSRLFSSLVLGLPSKVGLRYIGQVGTGFTARMQKELFKKLNPLFTPTCPFAAKPVTGAPTMWVKPALVCEVSYSEFTKDGVMRHPVFEGLRDDKTADEINVTNPPPLPAVGTQATGTSTNQALIQPGASEAVMNVDGHSLTLSNLKKIYWPEEKITKGQLLDYYHRMAPYILPYLQNRPQSLNRYPNGINGESFYQKDMKGRTEDWMVTHDYLSESDGEIKEFLVCTDAASLLYMANLGCIEMNPWHSRIDTIENPDWCVIDLDPGTVAFDKVIETARAVHDVLESLAIPSYPKTSGSTGIHVYIPLGARYSYEQSRQLAEIIANLVHNQLPAFTSVVRKRGLRKGKLYIDFLQNRSIQTISAPYSVRPRHGATVSAPLHWDEVNAKLKMSDFTIDNMKDRVRDVGDLFKGVLAGGIDMAKVLKSLATNAKTGKR